MTIKTSSFDVFGKTDQGRQRRDNQDNLSPPVATSDVEEELRATFGRLYIVADGVGGNERGDIASRMTVEHVHRYFYRELEPIAGEPLEARLVRAIQQASNDIFDAAVNKYNNNMASTIVAALWHPSGDMLTVANVGDSRAYLFPAAGSSPNLQLSTDHVLPGKKSGLSRSMGDPDVEVAIQPAPFAPDDVLVLCTDGLTDLLEIHEIERIVRGTGSNDAVQELIALANQRGGHDNITVTVLRNGKVPVLAQRGTRRKVIGAVGGVFALLSLALVLVFTIGRGGDFTDSREGDTTFGGQPFNGVPILNETTGLLETATPAPPTPETPAPATTSQPTTSQPTVPATGGNEVPLVTIVVPTAALVNTAEPNQPAPAQPPTAPEPPTPEPPTPEPPTPEPPTPEPQLVAVPNVVGVAAGDAYSLLAASGLQGAQFEQSGPGCAAFSVVSQEPPAGAQVPPGSTVLFGVCPQRTVPNVLGLPEAEALAVLTQAGLQGVVIEYYDDGSSPDGTVQVQIPGPDQLAPADGIVQLKVIQKRKPDGPSGPPSS